MGSLTKWSLTWSLFWVMFVAEKDFGAHWPKTNKCKNTLLFNYKVKDNLKILRLFYFKQDLSYYYTHILNLGYATFFRQKWHAVWSYLFFFYSVCFYEACLRLISFCQFLFSFNDVNLCILRHLSSFLLFIYLHLVTGIHLAKSFLVNLMMLPFFPNIVKLSSV